MKTRLFLIIMLSLSITVFAQNEQKNYLFTVGKHKLGGYVGTGGRISSVFSETAGFADVKVGIVFNGKWTVGLTGSALYYDKGLNDLVDDGTYHLNVGYTALFVERLFSLSDRFKLSVSIASGSGEAFYRYDKNYRKEKVWSEEYIDRTTFSMFEPALEIQYRIKGNFYLGLTGSYRNTSPLQLIGASESLLREFSGGVTLKYGIF